MRVGKECMNNLENHKEGGVLIFDTGSGHNGTRGVRLMVLGGKFTLAQEIKTPAQEKHHRVIFPLYINNSRIPLYL